MRSQLIFVPVTQAERRGLACGQRLPARRAFMVTPELCAALGYGPEETEDAEYAAMVIASVAGLARFGVRLVVVAEVHEGSLGQVVDAENGEVELEYLSPEQITAFFADDDQTAVESAAAASRDLEIDLAWELPQVQQLLNETDLLWHGSEEL